MLKVKIEAMGVYVVKLNFKDNMSLQKASEGLSINWPQFEEFNWDDFKHSILQSPQELFDKENLLKEGKYYLKFYFTDQNSARELISYVTENFPDCDVETSTISDEVIEEYLTIKQEIKIGNQLLITSLPLKEAKEKYPDFRYIISLVPGAAFGTGEHETTYSCLQAMLELEGEFQSFLDVGTGSGILAILAKMMGCTEVKGFDCDNLSIITAKENATKNGVTVEFGVSDVFTHEETEKYDLVAANIYADILKEVKDKIIAWSRKLILLSGIHETKASLIKDAFSERCKLIKTYPYGEWMTFLWEKEEE